MSDKRLKLNRYLLAGFAIVSIAVFIYYIFYLTEFFFHSDMAAYLSLASEQIRKKQFFPDQFCYSTGIFIFTAELFVVPLMYFISDWILCREIAILLINVIAFALIVFFFRKTGEDKKRMMITSSLAIVLWCLPMAHYEETVYEGAYVTLVIYEICIMLSLYNIVTGSEKKKRHYVLLFLAVFIANLEGIRDIAVIVIPLIVAIALFLFIDTFKDLDQLFAQKRYNRIIFTILFAALSAMAVFRYLSDMVGLKSADNGIKFAQEAQIVENFRNLITGILRYYGAIGNEEFISLNGFTACINFCVMLICCVIVPIYMLILYRKIKTPFWKIYILYCWISNLLVVYMMVFMSPFVLRYYYTVFFHNVVMTALLLGYLIEKEHKYINSFFLLCVAVVCIFCHSNYILDKGAKANKYYEKNRKKGTITEYLEENGLTYGFASYWNSYKNMVLSDGKVKIVAWKAHPKEPFYWLTSKDWYDPEMYPGKCFILLSKGESIDEKYYELASDVRKFRGYSVLIFDKHLYLYDELN